MKQIINQDLARQTILNAVKKLVLPVKATLGPNGRNVVLDNIYGTSIITNDGVTIAREIELEEKSENLIAKLIKEAAIKTNETVGDGTTTSLILTEAIITNGFKALDNSKNLINIKKGINYTLELFKEYIEKNSVLEINEKTLKNIATISSGSEELGKLISSVFESVGRNGLITIEESDTSFDKVIIEEGLKIDKGYLTKELLKQNTIEEIMKDAYILITDKKIKTVYEIMQILEAVSNQNKSLLIISDSIEEEALSSLVLNKLEGNLNVMAIEAPSYGEKRKEYLKDISIFTGGKFISKELFKTLQEVKITDLGYASSIKINFENTIIINGKKDQNEYQERIKYLEELIKETQSNFEKDYLEDRFRKLNSNFGVIKIGSATKLERIEKKLRAVDALSALEATLKKGISPGGGIVFLKFIKYLDSIKIKEEYKEGVNVVISSLSEPLKQILINSNQEYQEIIEKIKNSEYNIGYEIKEKAYVDMIEKGIIDPTLVSIEALTNAISIASTLLTVDSIIVDKTENTFENERISEIC